MGKALSGELSCPSDKSCYLIHQKFYRKNSKIWDTSNNCHKCPKNRKVWCNIALMHPKDAHGMANSVDPDQTASPEAVWSWSALFADTYLSQYIEFVWYTPSPLSPQSYLNCQSNLYEITMNIVLFLQVNYSCRLIVYLFNVSALFMLTWP